MDNNETQVKTMTAGTGNQDKENSDTRNGGRQDSKTDISK